jgi:MORN repeat variant
MDKLFLCIVCITLHVQLCAQNVTIPPNRIPIRYIDFMAYVMVYDGKVKTSSLNNERTYYWIKAKQIHQSKGGYEGDLLHGEYTALYRNDQLKEKGSYNKGLKTGEWKEWYTNGELKLVSHYKNGYSSGSFLYYNESGKLIKKEYYRSGNLNGKQFEYKDSTIIIAKYKYGRLVVPKTKKPKKVKIEKGIEVNPQLAPEKQEKERKKLFKKKNVEKSDRPENDKKSKPVSVKKSKQTEKV